MRERERERERRRKRERETERERIRKDEGKKIAKDNPITRTIFYIQN